MYRRPLLIVVLGLTLAGCYAGPGYYESDVYTAPVYGGSYYGIYDHYYRPGYFVGSPRYYGPRPGPYYAPRPGYRPGPAPYVGRGYYRSDVGGPRGHANPSWNNGHNGGGRGNSNGSGGRGGGGPGGNR